MGSGCIRTLWTTNRVHRLIQNNYDLRSSNLKLLYIDDIERMGEDKRYFETEEHVRLYVEARPTVPANLVTAIKQYLQAHLRTRLQHLFSPHL